MKKIVNKIVSFICGFKLTTLHKIGRIVGFAMWYCAPMRRQYTINTVQERLNLSLAEATKIAKASYINNACSFAELFHVGDFGIKDLHTKLELNDSEEYHHIFNVDRPIVIVAGHFGAWELLSSILGDCTIKRKAQVVVRKQKNKVMNEVIFNLRGANGAEILDHRHSAPKVVETLRNNGIVGFLVDHNTNTKEAIFLDFLGKEAAVNMGPAMLALRAKALVVPAFMTRSFDENNGKASYTLFIEKCLDTKTLQGSLKEQIKEVAEFYTQAVEKKVKEYPDQWFWMHRRWKTQRDKNN